MVCSSNQAIMNTETPPGNSTRLYGARINPVLARLMELLQLDKMYQRAEGSSLYYTDVNGREIRVADFVSGYGAVLLGHNDEKLTAAACEFFREKKPGFVQLSVKESATQTAQWLQQEMKAVTGKDFITVFASSGSEAIEAALKHALMEFREKERVFSEKFEQEAAFILHSFSRKDPALAAMAEEEIGRCRQQNQSILEKNTPVVLALEHAFHGKTLRAVQTCWNSAYRDAFIPENHFAEFIGPGREGIPPVFRRMEFRLMLPVIDPAGRLHYRMADFTRIAAVLAEPIQGEGGIRPLPLPFLRQLQAYCQLYEVPLVFDEVQSGCYRTGPFLASASCGFAADYYVLGKALGGGLAKIAAVLIEKNRYLESFGLIHSSTFAEDGWSSHVALHALAQSKEKSPLIRERGEKLFGELDKLKRAYPSEVRDLRGRGLLLGLEFRDFTESNSYCFQLMARSGYLHYLYAAYLLNSWGLRLAAPLSAKNVLRLQPACSISNDDIARLMEGLYALCEIIRNEDFYKLIEFLLPPSCQGLRQEPRAFNQGTIPREKPAEGAARIGFITHFINAGTVRAGDPSLSVLPDEVIEELMKKILPISAPTILGSTNILSKTGKPVHITFAGLSLTSALCRDSLSAKNISAPAGLCRKAVDLLKKEEGVRLVGLGQYSSILTNNGRMIPETEIGLTTGNSFTVYLGLEAVKNRLKEKGLSPARVKAGIIGAAGNIASIIAALLARDTAGILLLGSDSPSGYQNALRTARNLYQSAARELLETDQIPEKGLYRWLAASPIFRRIQKGEITPEDPRLYEKLEEEFGDRLFIKVVHSPADLRECRVVIAATNAAMPFLYPEHFAPHTLICDLSVPHSCSPGLVHNNKSIEVIFGGIAQLPHAGSIPVKGLNLHPGEVYGCMGETLLLGLEKHFHSYSVGNISRSQVEWIGKIARRHGFHSLPGRHEATEEKKFQEKTSV